MASDESKGALMRMDFAIEVLRADDAEHIVEFLIKPDPRRYDRITRNGKEYYLDRFLNIEFEAEKILLQCAEQAKGMPVSALSPTVKSTGEYSHQRHSALGRELAGGAYEPPVEAATPHGELVSSDEERWVSFLSLDVCGSTQLRQDSPSEYDEAYSIFFREIGTLISQFNCRILKHTGDGFVAYIDASSHNLQADNIVDLGTSIPAFVERAIRPHLLGRGLPAFDVRTGAEAGFSRVVDFSIPSSGYTTRDFSSDALNRAVKIQEQCGPNEFQIGRGLYEALHVQWLLRSEEIEPHEDHRPNSGRYRVK